MAQDWKELLGQLRQDPDLPPGEEPQSHGQEQTDPNPAKNHSDPLKVILDRKGRKGKTATIVEGFICSDAEVAEVAAMLKKKLGVGGSSRGGEILIQGDLADKVRRILMESGYKVK